MNKPKTGFWLTRIWRHTSLMQRLAFVSLLPTFVTALMLVTMLTRYQMTSLHRMGQNTADAIAIQAASVSAAPLRQMNRRELMRIARSIIDMPHLLHVQIRAANGEIVADSETRDTRKPRNELTVVRNIYDPGDTHGQGAPLGSVLVDVSLSDAIAAQQASLRNALIAVSLALLVAALMTWQAARWTSAPLRRLAHAVRNLGTGESPVQVEVTDYTEIGELQQGFNHSATALFDVQQGMQHEIKLATQELARKNDELEAASVAKARFLAAASHDLRQPLYALTLFSSAMAVDELDPVRLDRIAHIQECVAALDHLFSELLDLSRLESGAQQVEITAFALDQVFDGVSSNFRMIAEQHELRLVIRKTSLWVQTDRTMLARIINNLVSNALRYTEAGGVLVGARRQLDGKVRVDVWDTGSGIAPEHAGHVFDEFYRVDTHANSHEADATRRGLGLGLATVHRLAELLDTQVRLKSRPQQGTVFHFLLPGTAARSELELEPARPVPDVSGMRVWVIDDEPAILSGISFLLRSWGCEVAVAQDQAQALDLAEKLDYRPDLVISDLGLRHGENGLDVLAALDRHYADDGEPRFPRLLITGETRSDRLLEVRRKRIPMLYKPVPPEALREAIASVSRVAVRTI